MAGNTHADRGLSHDERLNLSVDIAGRHQLPGGGHSTRNSSVGYKKHSQARDYNLRMSRINEEKLNNSVHEFNSGKKQPNTGGIDHGLQELSLHQGVNHHHSKSLMKNGPDEMSLIDKKKEILDKKRYD